MSARTITTGFQERIGWTDDTIRRLLLDFVDDLEGGTQELADYLSARAEAFDPGPEEPGEDESGGLAEDDEPGDNGDSAQPDEEPLIAFRFADK